MAPRTRDRILDGAAEAVARHGLAKLEMSDVSATSGVSRGTLYRYFPGRAELLAALAEREGVLFKERMLAAIEAAPPGAERVRVAVEHVTRHVREHAALQRLLETDPALVLRGLRDRFPSLKAEFGTVLEPLLSEVELVRRRVVSVEQLVDWMMRLMVSAFLMPESQPDAMASGLAAVYRMLSSDSLESAAPSRRSATAKVAKSARANAAVRGRPMRHVGRGRAPRLAEEKR